MLYITAEFWGRSKFVGVAEDSGQALNISDNIGTLFSEGHPPSTVVVTVEDAAGDMLLKTSFYNGFFTQLEADEELIKKYSHNGLLPDTRTGYDGR